MDLSKHGQSAFALTFAIEILGLDVFHDCNEGWLDLGAGPVQGLKLQYQLAPGRNFDLDILIWPHAAKIWCGMNSGWVRTWQFLQRRWFAFSIHHMFPVRVMDFKDHVATVSSHVGLGNISTNARNDKNINVFLPKLAFGDRRQFAQVLVPEEDISLIQFFHKYIWSLIVDYIPTSSMDGAFDTPEPVKDKRHQDAVLGHVQKVILDHQQFKDTEGSITAEEHIKVKGDVKGKDKTKKAEAVKFEIKLTGDAIIAGTGRIVPFMSVGDKQQDQGEIIVLISSASLPAHDDYPITFLNIGKLFDVPLEEFKKHKITHLYTKWVINGEEHCSQLKEVNLPHTEIDFNDNHAVPLSFDIAADVLSTFADKPYQVELHGMRPEATQKTQPSFFGYEIADRDFSKTMPPKLPTQHTDILVAMTKIDTKPLKSANSFLRGEYPLYPPEMTLKSLERELNCTNDINAVRIPFRSELVVPASVILEAQMTLEVSIGTVGCKPHKMSKKYSRLYCLFKDSKATMNILHNIAEANEQIVDNGVREDLLTGFALDTGDSVLLYVEGPRDGQILRVWEETEKYPEVKSVFSMTAKHHSRLYPGLVTASTPFNILKMFVPLSLLLACPSIYARPALPLPSRSAVLKIDRLIASKLLIVPNASLMPTMAELQSFRLELCIAPRPPPLLSHTENFTNRTASELEPPLSKVQTAQKINWAGNDNKKDNEKHIRRFP